MGPTLNLPGEGEAAVEEEAGEQVTAGPVETIEAPALLEKVATEETDAEAVQAAETDTKLIAAEISALLQEEDKQAKEEELVEEVKVEVEEVPVVRRRSKQLVESEADDNRSSCFLTEIDDQEGESRHEGISKENVDEAISTIDEFLEKDPPQSEEERTEEPTVAVSAVVEEEQKVEESKEDVETIGEIQDAEVEENVNENIEKETSEILEDVIETIEDMKEHLENAFKIPEEKDVELPTEDQTEAQVEQESQIEVIEKEASPVVEEKADLPVAEVEDTPVKADIEIETEELVAEDVDNIIVGDDGILTPNNSYAELAETSEPEAEKEAMAAAAPVATPAVESKQDNAPSAVGGNEASLQSIITALQSLPLTELAVAVLCLFIALLWYNK